MANILDVVQTIQNIVGQKGYDGALDEEASSRDGLEEK